LFNKRLLTYLLKSLNCSQTAADSSMVTIGSLYNLQTPYPMVPLLIPYNVLFSHGTYVTDDRQTDNWSYHKHDH